MSAAQSPFIQQCLETPVTALTCLLLIVIWFPLWNSRIAVDTVAFSYAKVVTQHEWWRVLSAAHAHFDPFHLLFNVMALWSCRPIEFLLGPSWIFLIQSLTFAIVCKLLMIGVLHVGAKQFPGQTRGWLEQYTVGYSAVIFAWMTVLSAHANGIISVFGLVDVPGQYAPFVSLLITQLLVRNASFIGHAAGIVAGGMHIIGMFDWLRSPYWALIWALWIAGVCAVSLKATTRVPVPCISYVNCWGEENGGSSGGRGQGEQRRMVGSGHRLGGTGPLGNSSYVDNNGGVALSSSQQPLQQQQQQQQPQQQRGGSGGNALNALAPAPTSGPALV